MRIVMIGSGYVGLVSGACFADFGHNVCCVDKDEGKIASLREGKMPIFEPGLDELVAKNTASGRLQFSLDIAEALPDADAVFIAVGTPSLLILLAANSLATRFIPSCREFTIQRSAA